ncbi:Hypothetical protein HDN1F_33520 [gamma proteobacterium HdN1]|nr:Hypothetical protein HDN1F_33520 [gamma proteobacterium HdN1]
MAIAEGKMMRFSKGVRCIFALLIVTSVVGCKATDEVTVTGFDAKDHTSGAINGVEKHHAWVVQGVQNQTVQVGVSILNKHNKTSAPLNTDSVILVGDRQTRHFLMNPCLDKKGNPTNCQQSEISLNYNAPSLPALDVETKTRVADRYTVQADYGADTMTSAPAVVEVLRPYCQVNAAPFSTLGMTFETPIGAAPAAGWPTLLFVHGGGLNRRNHVDMEAYAASMLEQGYAVANMNYRLVDTEGGNNSTIYAKAASWKDPVSDVKCAIRYLKENSAVLKLNANKIGLVGHSSGANIAMEAALTVNSSMPEFAEQGTPIHLGSAAQGYDTSVAALFTMDAIVNYSVFWKLFDESVDAFVKAQPLSTITEIYSKKSVSDFINEQTIINGFSHKSDNWENHPSAIAQNMVTQVNLQTDLPVYMEHSTVVRKFAGLPLKTAPYNSWKSGCTFVNAVQATGSAKQRGQTFAKDVVNGSHEDFVANAGVVGRVTVDMLGFFDYYLKNQGAKPSTGFDYSRCASLNAG